MRRSNVVLSSDHEAEPTNAPKAIDTTAVLGRRTRKAPGHSTEDFILTAAPEAEDSRTILPALEEKPEPDELIFATNTEPRSRNSGNGHSQGKRKKASTKSTSGTLKSAKQTRAEAQEDDLKAPSDEYATDSSQDENPPKKPKLKASSKTASSKAASSKAASSKAASSKGQEAKTSTKATDKGKACKPTQDEEQAGRKESRKQNAKQCGQKEEKGKL